VPGHATWTSLRPHEVEDPVFFRSTRKFSEVGEDHVTHERTGEALIVQEALEMLHGDWRLLRCNSSKGYKAEE
jgi:hypothetical protein